MKIIGSMTLQPKRSVSVIKVMNKVLIVGVSEDGMHTLGEIGDEASLKQIEAKLSSQPAPAQWFAKKNKANSSVTFAEALSLQFSKLRTKR
jgi:flagellar biogenesis protein FliO